MRKANRYARTSALPAIVAVLALSSTQGLAQEAPAQPTQPVTTDPAPTVSATPAPTVDVAPPSTDTAISAPDVPAAPKTRTATHVRTASAARPAVVSTSHKATQTAARTPASAAPAVAAPAAAPAPSAPPAGGPAVKPVVDMTAPPSKPATAPAAKPANSNDTALEIGGGALALLAVGAGAWALSRRRHEEEAVYEEAYEPEAAPEPEPVAHEEPVFEEQPPLVAPEMSAFSWGNRAPASESEDDGSDRRPGETWVERAYRGPSLANPSVSLKTRLRRAAFFDKRERDVAAGKAEPIEADAGLPEAMVEEQQSEPEFA